MSWRKRQRTPILDVTSSKCPINVRVNTVQQRKGKAEDKDPEVLLPEKLLLKSSITKRRERIRLAKKIDLRATATRREIVVVTQNVPIGIIRTVNTSRRRTPDCERIVFTPTPKRKIVPHIFNEEVKENRLQKNVYESYFEYCESAAWETRRGELSDLRLRRMLIGKPKATLSE